MTIGSVFKSLMQKIIKIGSASSVVLRKMRNVPSKLCNVLCATQNAQWAMWNTKCAKSNVQRVIEKRNILATLLTSSDGRGWWQLSSMDQNMRKIKMRNDAKQDKIVLGCDDVSYVILPNVKCCSCQKRARFSRKARSATQKKSRSRSKEKSEDGQKKNQIWPKKSRKSCSGWRQMLFFFWIDHACASSPPPKLFRKFFLLTKNGFWQTGPNSILWKSVRSTLIFWPLKNLYWRAQGNQLWTVSHELCYISSEKATYIVFIFSYKVFSMSTACGCEPNALALKCG